MNQQGYGMNQERAQLSNRALLLKLIRAEGVCSRVWLAQASGLQQSTVTVIVNDFLRWGIVRETGQLHGAKGRRSIGLELDSAKFGVLGVRISRNKVSAGMFGLDGACRAYKAVNIETECTLNEYSEIAARLAEEIIAGSGDRRILAAGVTLPGRVSTKEGTVVLISKTGVRKVKMLEDFFSKTLKVPAIVCTDATAGIWAQFWSADTYRDEDTLVYICIGQRVNATVLTGGKVLEGNFGHSTVDPAGPACECGGRGCLENYISTGALEKYIETECGIQMPFSQIAQRIRAGEPAFLAAYRRCCDLVGEAVVGVVNMLAPDEVILGDEMAAVLPQEMESRVKAVVERRVIPELNQNLCIRTEILTTGTELHGAAVNTIREIYRNTASYFSAAAETELE